MNWRGSFNQRCKIYNHEFKRKCIPKFTVERKVSRPLGPALERNSQPLAAKKLNDDSIIGILIEFGDKYYTMRYVLAVFLYKFLY